VFLFGLDSAAIQAKGDIAKEKKSIYRSCYPEMALMFLFSLPIKTTILSFDLKINITEAKVEKENLINAKAYFLWLLCSRICQSLTV
jgi:hypothetical protein